MPRYKRTVSSTGVYHVMLRGIDKMNIFLDDHDRMRFLRTLVQVGKKGEYILYAYCLMTNHVHLLIKECADPISRIMKRIGVSYSGYFNKKYARVGHLFQDRYKSEPIERENYLLSCTRYIHLNPVKAGLVKKVNEYEWSSFREYIDQTKYEFALIDTELVLRLFADKRDDAIKAFMIFTNQEDEVMRFLEYEGENIKQKSLEKLIEEILLKYDVTIEELNNYKDKAKRDLVLREVKTRTKSSLRKLAKILKINKDIIHKA